MSRKTVEAITSDLSGSVYLATEDGSTTVPFTYLLEDGTTVNADLTPAEKKALYDALTGNVEALTTLLMGMRPKAERNAMATERRNDIIAWIHNTDGGDPPKRVTTGMEARYDAHIVARDAKAAADEAAKVAARQSRQDKRDAAKRDAASNA